MSVRVFKNTQAYWKAYRTVTDLNQNYNCHVKHSLVSQILNLIRKKINYVSFQHIPNSIRPNVGDNFPQFLGNKSVTDDKTSKTWNACKPRIKGKGSEPHIKIKWTKKKIRISTRYIHNVNWSMPVTESHKSVSDQRQPFWARKSRVWG